MFGCNSFVSYLCIRLRRSPLIVNPYGVVDLNENFYYCRFLNTDDHGFSLWLQGVSVWI